LFLQKSPQAVERTEDSPKKECARRGKEPANC
jgi:hypothetical protein